MKLRADLHCYLNAKLETATFCGLTQAVVTDRDSRTALVQRFNLSQAGGRATNEKGVCVLKENLVFGPLGPQITSNQTLIFSDRYYAPLGIAKSHVLCTKLRKVAIASPR